LPKPEWHCQICNFLSYLDHGLGRGGHYDACCIGGSIGNQRCHCMCSYLCLTAIQQNPLPHLSAHRGGLGTRITDWPSWKDSQQTWHSQGSVWWVDQKPLWWGTRPLQIHLSWREACNISLHMYDRFIPLSCRWVLSVHNRDNIKVCHFFHSLNWITNLSRYFREMLLFFSSPPFYPDNVHLLTANTPLLSKIPPISLRHNWCHWWNPYQCERLTWRMAGIM